jgi:diacylglycerol kinase (ATP)
MCLIKIGPAFPSAGGLFLEFPTFDLAIRITLALENLQSCPKIILLPTIHPDAVGFDQEPLLVFVNGKSGGNQGVKLISGFRRHLNPHQVYDLMNGGPLPGLYAFRHVRAFRVMICGGDGTFGWVLSALQDMREFLACSSPPCAVLPLGTGNDLARALNWGGGYTGEKVMQLLLAIEDANTVSLDRWTLSWDADPSLLPSNRSSSLGSPGSSPAILTSPQSVVMNNYCGIGLDAAIALEFHNAREENPEKFNSRFHNKGVYFQLGLQKMVSKSECSNIQKHLKLTVDGNKVDLPELEGIIILNIRSWGAGKDPWGSAADSLFTTPAMDDGKLEVVGISGAFHMVREQVT